MKLTLPSGAEADLLSPDKLKAKHVRAMTRAISNMGDQRVGAMVVDVTDGAIAIVVQSWTCTDDDSKPLPIPSEDFKSLDELDAFDYYALLNHPFVTEVNQKFAALRDERDNPDDHDDPDSPSEPSDASRPVSRAELSPPAKTAATAGTKRRTTSGSPSDGAGPRSR
jgi:hypothetical protein